MKFALILLLMVSTSVYADSKLNKIKHEVCKNNCTSTFLACYDNAEDGYYYCSQSVITGPEKQQCHEIRTQEQLICGNKDDQCRNRC